MIVRGTAAVVNWSTGKPLDIHFFDCSKEPVHSPGTKHEALVTEGLMYTLLITFFSSKIGFSFLSTK